MEVLLREIGEQDVRGPRCRAALYRLNAIHAQYVKYGITDQDMAYVLSIFMLAPYRFLRCGLGWRDFTEKEKAAIFAFWQVAAREMGIKTAQQWQDMGQALAWMEQYEAEHMEYAPTNELVATSTLEYYAKMLPRAIRHWARPVYGALVEMMDPRLREALGFAPPPTWAPKLCRGAFDKGENGGGVQHTGYSCFPPLAIHKRTHIHTCTHVQR